MILRDIDVIEALGWQVTTPLGASVIDRTQAFVRFTSDESSWSDEQIEQAAVEKILQADWVYARSPRGYAGRTACYEIGRIIQAGRPLYLSAQPRDLPIKVPLEHIGPPEEFAKRFLVSEPHTFPAWG